MKNTTNQVKKTYRCHDPELRKIVQATQDPSIAIDIGVSRGTAYYWAYKMKVNKQEKEIDNIFQSKIIKLQKKLEVEIAKVQFISSLGKYLDLIKNTKKTISKDIKKVIVNRVKKYQKYCSLKELLNLIQLSENRYNKWKSELSVCPKTGTFRCGVKRLNQLTSSEIFNILELAKSIKYKHYSKSALWRYSIKNKLISCSVDTWFKYINMFDLNHQKGKKLLLSKVGVRAQAPNQIWHIDISIIQLPTGEKLYLQDIIDNYSRFIIDWGLSTSKKAQETFSLINRALDKRGTFEELYMDSGTENKNKKVDSIFIGNQLKRVLAQVDVRFSNSMIESFFKSLKNNYLYQEEFASFTELKRKVAFYIKEHNTKIPHHAFDFATPEEVYFNKWGSEHATEIDNFKKLALQRRKEKNAQFIKCSKYLVA
ncbi:MAG: DDE-type integrase/transposase/recombinase [Bacteriovoracaceae bacterium]|jgi:transposase InsO family protein|nr:DDE-type integrase/transposase/recombinase [Bacteriovoracaceae bacterium]